MCVVASRRRAKYDALMRWPQFLARKYSGAFLLGVICGVATVPISIVFSLLVGWGPQGSELILLLIVGFGGFFAWFIWKAQSLPAQWATRMTPHNVDDLEDRSDALDGTGRYAGSSGRSWYYGFILAVILMGLPWVIVVELLVDGT